MRLNVSLRVSQFARSLRFYTDIVGFTALRLDAQHRCAELEREGMTIEIIEDTAPPLAPLEYPYGRGATLVVWVYDIEEVVAGVSAFGARLSLPPTIREHVENGASMTHVAAEICDPDGYCWRFCQSLAD